MKINLSMNTEYEAFKFNVGLEAELTGVTALFGPSGCGKTSILRSIAGLNTDPSTVLSVDGESWQNKGFKLETCKRGVGFVLCCPGEWLRQTHT